MTRLVSAKNWLTLSTTSRQKKLRSSPTLDVRTVANTLFEFQTDSLASVDTSNAVIEGASASASDASATATKRMQNYTQISRKVISVSGTEEVVNKAGRNSELAYLLAKQAPS
jgi:hypothetical protein